MSQAKPLRTDPWGIARLHSVFSICRPASGRTINFLSLEIDTGKNKTNVAPWSVESQLLRGVFTWISKYPPKLDSLDRTTAGLGTEPSVSGRMVLWPLGEGPMLAWFLGWGPLEPFVGLGSLVGGPLVTCSLVGLLGLAWPLARRPAILEPELSQTWRSRARHRLASAGVVSRLSWNE